MSTIFFILLIITMVAVLAVLMVGLFAMASAGEFNRKYGNKLMQARVGLQGLAIIFFLLTIATQGQ